jgi:hypothetical protein
MRRAPKGRWPIISTEFERSMTSRDGKRLGRPPLDPKTREPIQDALRAPGRPAVRKIAEQFGVNTSTVQQISSGL